MIHQRQVLSGSEYLIQQRFDEMIQMIDLFQFASAVLVELAVACQDMQLLEQFDRLAGFDF